MDDDGLGSAASCDDSTPALTTPMGAIAVSAHGDTVLVCPGTYIGLVNVDDKEITIRSVAGPAVTILDGNGDGTVITFRALRYDEGHGAVLEGFTIRNGVATAGGGIVAVNTSPIIRGNLITQNGASSFGGGIASSGGSPTIEGNTIVGNAGGFWGGGLHIKYSESAVIRRNVIAENTAGDSGGGITLMEAGAPLVEFNSIVRNTATVGGGIDMAYGSDAVIVGNVIGENRGSRRGGGVSWFVDPDRPGPRLLNNTIAGNDSPVGSAVYAEGYDSSVLLANNIISSAAGQPAVTCNGDYDWLAPVFRSNNVFSAGGSAYDGVCSDQTGVTGNISAQPLFVDLAAGDFHLQPGSPGVDAGDNGAASGITTDLDGRARVVDGDRDGRATVDIGAFEATPPGRRAPYDFAGRSHSDLAVWRPSTGTWYARTSTSGDTAATSVRWGAASLGDRPVAADYDADGLTDEAVWRESTGTWLALLSGPEAGPSLSVRWGTAGDRPVPGDYDGDGKADPAVWRPSNGTWYVLLSGAGHTRSRAIRWGVATDTPVPADFDGDGRMDLAVWRPGSGTWYVLTSRSEYEESFSVQWGVGSKGDVPVAGDYDGDGKADPAVWRPGNGTWYVRRSSTSYATSFSVQWGVGASGDVPVVADFDGDARVDVAVWRPGSGTWYVKTSGSSYAASFAVQWGARGDTPMGGAAR